MSWVQSEVGQPKQQGSVLPQRESAHDMPRRECVQPPGLGWLVLEEYLKVGGRETALAVSGNHEPWGKMMAFTEVVVEEWKTDIRLFKSEADRALGMWGQRQRGQESSSRFQWAQRTPMVPPL